MLPLAILALLGATATVDAVADEAPKATTFWEGGTPSGDIWTARALRNTAALRRVEQRMEVPLRPWQDGWEKGVFQIVYLSSSTAPPVLVVLYQPYRGTPWQVDLACGPQLQVLSAAQRQAVGSMLGGVLLAQRAGRFGLVG